MRPAEPDEAPADSGHLLECIEDRLEPLIRCDGMTPGTAQPALTSIAQNRVMVPAATDQGNVARADTILIGVNTNRAALIDQAMTRGERNPAFRFGQAEESNDLGGGLYDACTMCWRHGSRIALVLPVRKAEPVARVWLMNH